jgi:hypothetical protein
MAFVGKKLQAYFGAVCRRSRSRKGLFGKGEVNFLNKNFCLYGNRLALAALLACRRADINIRNR